MRKRITLAAALVSGAALVVELFAVSPASAVSTKTFCAALSNDVDTANTLCKAAQALKEEGAVRVVAYCTHPVLSGGAVQRIAESEMDELVVTDSIPLSKAAQACSKIRVLSVAGLLAETILRISNEDSVSSLFME